MVYLRIRGCRIQAFFGGFATFLPLLCGTSTATPAADALPNILWITSEDHGPHLGCYGDRQATTPNVDRLAARGVLYPHVWSCAPVCAPARTTLIAGLYANATGGEHMRSMVPYPAGKQMFPQLLRAAGYYCTNNVKTDYNLAQPGQVWDASSSQAHWRNRRPGQPFFAVFNSGKSHEGQIRARPHTAIHDPAKVRVPAYHPDTPEVRQDWAQYYDGVTAADADAGERLRELDATGLADSTIVFYFADHGSGMPRSKRWPYDSGLHVPLVIYIPERFRALRPEGYLPGGRINRLVSFVDFAPTVLSLAGIRPPDWMQGRAFLGEHAAAAPQYIFGFRGRMDERYDLVRSATDGRFVYVRNYLPQRIYGQHLNYMFQTPSTRAWHQLHLEGRLSAVQDAFWKTKPREELYDLASDPDEVTNLAASAEHQQKLAELRQAVHNWILDIRDVGFLPEGEMIERSRGGSPYDLGHDAKRYPLERILQSAELASSASPGQIDRLIEALGDSDSAVRYWGAVGLLIQETAGSPLGRERLELALDDDSPYVRIVAAEALARFGNPSQRQQGEQLLVELADARQSGIFVALAALNAIDCLEPEISQALKARLPKDAAGVAGPDRRYGEYVPRLLPAAR